MELSTNDPDPNIRPDLFNEPDKIREPSKCLRCHKAFDAFEEKINMRIHTECLNCHYCQRPVQLEIVIRELMRDETVCHKPCEDSFMEQEFKNKPVQITQAKLDYLNRCNLMFSANLDLSVDTNQKEAALLANLFIVDMTLDQKFITLKRIEAIAAMMSIALSKDKNRAIAIIDQREKDKFQEVQEYRKKQVEVKEPKTKTESAPRLKLSPEEKAHKKMVDSYRSLGFNDEQIQQIIAAANKSKGESS